MRAVWTISEEFQIFSAVTKDGIILHGLLESTQKQAYTTVTVVERAGFDASSGVVCY